MSYTPDFKWERRLDDVPLSNLIAFSCRNLLLQPVAYLIILGAVSRLYARLQL